MPWIVGVDEAGYGPNLGPLVITSVAFRVPDGLTSRSLWKVLKKVVRRAEEEDDGRLLIEDSKVVYSPARGLLDLERGVLAALSLLGIENTRSRQLLDWICPGHTDDLGLETWFTGESNLPNQVPPDTLAEVSERLRQCCQKKEVELGLVRSVIVCPSRFNSFLDQWGSKGAILGHGLSELIHCNLNAASQGEQIVFHVDKHGGRNNYYAMLQEALPDSMVVSEKESMDKSVYRVVGGDRGISFTFQPRADSEYFGVALASMVSKYLREILMLEFNAYWQERVPGIEPTAGYPTDAGRFFQAIRPAVLRLGIPEEAVWRRR
jgi:ribonuclease HII